MDNETILEQFNAIENRIESLITTRKSLEAANEALKKKVSALESELQGRHEEKNRDSEVRVLIRSKIDSLLERLDGITEANN